jgi:phosphohistidine swiveling domain-containing protein
MNLDPRKYDYLWTDHEVNYIFASCYLFNDARKAGLLFIYDFKDKGLKFYLPKSSRKRLSAFGVKLYSRLFSEWKRETLKNIALGKRLIKETEMQKNKIKDLSNIEIKSAFEERVNLFQALAGNYFYTEFFFLDEVERILNENFRKNNLIARHVQEMGPIKLSARKVLNDFYNFNIVFRPYVEEIEKRTSRQDIQWLSYGEIYKILDGKRVSRSNRGRTNWILTRENRLISGDFAEKIIKNFDRRFFNVDENLIVIKGNIANTGQWKGKARIIKTIFSNNIIKEISKIKKGDVLVAATTGPEIMTAIKKAGAIVTDEGGITSHAAIISRELKIPCVIGTKIATKVLKDGDLVEVDAEKGVVKILKK